MPEGTNIETATNDVVQESEKTYTQKELDSAINSAVMAAQAKAKAKATKSSEDRISELERELSRRDNQDYARSKMEELGLDISLVSLVYADSNEVTDARIEVLSNWYKGAIEKGVADIIKESKPIKMAQSSSPSNRRRSLSEIQASLN